jgi:hypothetical protein
MFKKYFFLIVMGLSLTSPFILSKAYADNATQIEKVTLPFSMSFPSTFKTYQNQGGFDLLGIGPDKIIVGIKAGPANVTTEVFFENGVKLIPKTVKGFAILEKGTQKIDGVDSLWVIYRGLFAGGWSDTLQFFIVKDNTAYLIVMSLPEQDFGANRDNLFKLATYFRFAK